MSLIGSALHCTALSIEHRLTKPRHPQTNGMVERFNGRIADVLATNLFQSGEDLSRTIERYVWLYNQHLPQLALEHQTPLQAMKKMAEREARVVRKTRFTIVRDWAFSRPYAAGLGRQVDLTVTIESRRFTESIFLGHLNRIISESTFFPPSSND
jgi:hypothetical protein